MSLYSFCLNFYLIYNYLFYINSNGSINEYSTSIKEESLIKNNYIKYPRRWESNNDTALYLQQNTPFDNIDLIFKGGGTEKRCYFKSEIDNLKGKF